MRDSKESLITVYQTVAIIVVIADYKILIVTDDCVNMANEDFSTKIIVDVDVILILANGVV